MSSFTPLCFYFLLFLYYFSYNCTSFFACFPLILFPFHTFLSVIFVFLFFIKNGFCSQPPLWFFQTVLVCLLSLDHYCNYRHFIWHSFPHWQTKSDSISLLQSFSSFADVSAVYPLTKNYKAASKRSHQHKSHAVVQFTSELRLLFTQTPTFISRYVLCLQSFKLSGVFTWPPPPPAVVLRHPEQCSGTGGLCPEV